MVHAWHDVTPGEKLPREFRTIIEIPFGSSVKYELDKSSGMIMLDRVLYSAVYYPANYGFVPHTLSPDGDPIDALVVARSSFIPGCVVRVRPITRVTAEIRSAAPTTPMPHQEPEMLSSQPKARSSE